MKTYFPALGIAVILVFAGTLVACGQRGPLYMPGEKPAKKSPATGKQTTPTLPNERITVKPEPTPPGKPSSP